MGAAAPKIARVPDWKTVAWPRAADADAAARLRQDFAAIGRPEAALVRGQPKLFDAIGGNSPYLADLARRESAVLRQLVKLGPGAVVAQAMARITDAAPDTARAGVAALLRQAKRQVALAAAVADIAGVWTLRQVTTALSELAEAALRLAVRHLLVTAAAAGALRLPQNGDPTTGDPRTGDPAVGSGFTVLGMGKLGAQELNYSSDIDLVLLYDPAAHPYNQDGLSGCFTRIARGLIALMQERDADGYVFRTDLRLRPDPAATPPAIALPAMIAYYESMGQNWERAAMLKARPVAGDLRLGAAFLEAIRPFIWRKHLDFAAVADIHAMKRRIDAHKGRRESTGDPVARIAGHNLKLGRGGIREIEFLAQTLQLVWGGREPSLRDPTTLGALRVLVRAGHLPARSAGELARAYRFLRTAEHRLQMIADRQTHEVPARRDQIDAWAMFLGYDDAAALAPVLLDHCDRVQHRYAQVFEAVPDEVGPCQALDFRGSTERPATLAALTSLGFANAEAIVATVRGWHAGRLRALRSQRSRELLDLVLPRLFAALAQQAQPDVAFARFDGFLARLPAGVQLLSLFHRNPNLIDRIIAVLGAAPSLADHLAQVPAALEGLLSPDQVEGEAPLSAGRLLRERLRDARGLDEAMVAIGRLAREEDFRIAVATMEGRLDADAAGIARTSVADAALAAALPRVLADQIARYGRVRGGAMVVVALGKAGGREMMAGSDLDLMLIYDHPADVTESTVRNGRGRVLPASQWYIRAAHAYIAALTAPGPAGALYAVDMRLRPSGRKGPVAVSLTSFRNYHRDSAWTWERMALTRARVVAGPPALAASVGAAIAEAMRSAGPCARIRADAAAMRARLARDLPPSGPWDVKLRSGGQMEVEFIAQVQLLCQVDAHPDLASPTTRVQLRRLREAGVLDADDAALLTRADHVWRSVQGLLRITIGRTIGPVLPEPSERALLAAVGAVDLPDLHATLEVLADQVRAAFTRLVGAPVPALLEEK